MPEIKPGESEDDYVARCIPYVIKNEGATPEQAAGKCHGMYRSHQKQNYFEPPEAGDLSEHGKKILAAVYNSCRSDWVKDHPNDRENQANKTSCAKQAWAAVHRAGYSYQSLPLPTPVKGERMSDFMDRCPPIAEAEGFSPEMAKGCCLGAWDDWLHDKPRDGQGDGQGERGGQWVWQPYSPKQTVGPSSPIGDGTGRDGQSAGPPRNKELYHFDVDCDHALSFIMEPIELKDDKIKDVNKFTAIALKGDRFYKGKFLPFKEIEKTYRQMDGAYHDINHWGTSYPIDGHPNIEYIIGYQKNTTIDLLSKSMKTDIIVNPEAPHYRSWKNFVDINKQAGRTPNVSVSFWASNKIVKASDLPYGINYEAEGYKASDDVKVLHDLEFQALSTVFKGACDDTQGCGIMKQDNKYDEEKIRLELMNTQMRILKEEKTL
jgi:cation transport regulator ChaB